MVAAADVGKLLLAESDILAKLSDAKEECYCQGKEFVEIETAKRIVKESLSPLLDA